MEVHEDIQRIGTGTIQSILGLQPSLDTIFDAFLLVFLFLLKQRMSLSLVDICELRNATKLPKNDNDGHVLCDLTECK